MAKPKRISATQLDADRMVVRALRDLSDYAPYNSTASAAALLELEAALAQAEQAEIWARHTFEQARNNAIAAGQRLHAAVIEAKAAVLAQYGPESPAVSAVGLKKRSEYRRSSRRPKPAI